MNVHIRSLWTDARVIMLRNLLAADLSAAQIAEIMGISRNAVIGKVHRSPFDFSRKGHRTLPRPEVTRPKNPPPAERVKTRLTIQPARNNGNGGPVHVVEDYAIDLPPDQSDFACTIMDLRAEMCRWPLGKPSAAMLYCGGPCERTYCERHSRIAYVGPERRK